MKFLSDLERIHSCIRMISLDVAAAALGGGILASKVIGARPRWSFYWLLPAGVWVAYTVDHLLDAHRMGPQAQTPRHRFHHQHSGLLWTAVGFTSLICGLGGWRTLSWFGLIYAAIMCGLVIAHETIIKLAGNRVSPLLIKELGVALVFTIGVWGMPWLRHRMNTGHVSGWPILLMVQYFLFAVVNLIEFSIYEARIDTADGQTSFVRAIGRRSARHITFGLLALQVPLGVFGSLRHPNRIVGAAETIYLLMGCGLWIVIAMPRFMARAERYRTLGDGVFLLPLAMIWF